MRVIVVNAGLQLVVKRISSVDCVVTHHVPSWVLACGRRRFCGNFVMGMLLKACLKLLVKRDNSVDCVVTQHVL